MPEAYYKYMSYSTAEIVLKNQTLRWTTPATLNDPYDIQFDLRIDFDRKAALELTIEKLWNVINGKIQCSINSPIHKIAPLLQLRYKKHSKEDFTLAMTDGILESFASLDKSIQKTREDTRAILSSIKVLCLTDSPKNQLMWAYYADSNKGAVLRFENVAELDSPYKTARPINYRTEVPMLFDEEGISNTLSGLTKTDPQEIFETLIYTKSAAWSHEREWRICSGDGRNKDAPHEDIRFGTRELTGVIFGCRMPNDQKHSLSEIIKKSYPHTQLLQATTINHSYELEIAKL